MARKGLNVDIDKISGSGTTTSALAPDPERRRELLRYAREAARRSARRDPDRLTTMDEVNRSLERAGHGRSALGPAAGSVFRTEGWWGTPFRLRSCRPGSRGRLIVIWEWVGKQESPSCPRRGRL